MHKGPPAKKMLYWRNPTDLYTFLFFIFFVKKYDGELNNMFIVWFMFSLVLVGTFNELKECFDSFNIVQKPNS